MLPSANAPGAAAGALRRAARAAGADGGWPRPPPPRRLAAGGPAAPSAGRTCPHRAPLCRTAPNGSSPASATAAVSSTSTTTAAEAATSVADGPDARWRVRPYDNSDYSAVIDVQTDSFHNAKSVVPFLNNLIYANFRAEVVDALQQKVKYLDPTTFQLLVVEEQPAPSADTTAASASSPEAPSCGADASSATASAPATQPAAKRPALVGVVEVSVLSERPVLRALPDPPATEYAYISSMCVRQSLRRQGLARVLMAAAEAQARAWRQPHLALHVYRDNLPAVSLYKNCGMAVLAEDPGWKAFWGDRVRLLMHKRLELPPDEAQEAGAQAAAAAAEGGAGAGAQAGP